MESDSDSVARQRFHAFKMGGGAPANSLHAFSAHSHRRSRSRNSVSSLPLSASAPALSPPPDSPNASLAPPTRPTSHHHRRSSVSTRCESAELMGVSLPELPATHSDDNINLGDKDSIRRRALRALEGKPDLAFSKVEIPDISSPDTTLPCEFPTKPSFPPGSGLNGTSAFAAKRDSFGKMFGSTSASKDQLGTLVEEEEEEEEEKQEKEKEASPTDQMQEPKESPAGLPAKIRHRPASLNLRPLSLVQGTVVNTLAGNLPTPSPTPGTHPSCRKHLVTATFDDAALPIVSAPLSNASIPVLQMHSSKRFSYNFLDSTSASCDLGPKRRSSISYKRSVGSVPRDMLPQFTPDISPMERRFSFASDQETLIEQPLSAADQHFLFRSHHVLLSRITELERTLRNRSSSRHHSYTSDASTAYSEPSNEMLHLISDLKAERDELKRDVDGWRQRVADADKQASMLAQRIESERREAWVARSRLSLLEVEKSALDKSMEAKTAALSQSLAENTALMRERDEFKDEIMKLNARLMDADALVDECTRLRGALEQERTRRKELEKLLDDAGLLNTPKLSHTINGPRKRPPFSAKPVGTRPRGLGFQSVDSESSTTDVESLDDSFTKAEFTLDAVTEEEAEFSDEDNGLAGYEDEEDSDLSFSSPDGSCIGSADELDIKSATPVEDILDHLVCSPLPTQPTHGSRASLSKTWTFPRGKTAVPVERDDDIDRFFGCLEDADRSPPLTEEMNQSMFSSAFRSMSDDDELPPFVLPLDVGVVVETSSSGSLGVVPEEDEGGVADDEGDELVGEEVEGGIRFTFNAPPIICISPPSDACSTPPPGIRITPPLETNATTPSIRLCMDDSSRPVCISEPVEDDEDESSLTFVFPPEAPRPVDRVTSSPRSSPPTSSGSSRLGTSPPSSIPRAISLRSTSPKTPSIMFTPPKNVSGRASASSTSPSKITSSSIPQPVTSPKFHSIPMRAQVLVDPLKQSRSGTPNANDTTSAPRCSSFTQSGGATSKVNYLQNRDPSLSSGVCEYSHAQDTSSLSSIMSNPLAARSPFRKLSDLISFAWTPGATAVASYIVPSSSVSPGVEAVDTATSLSGVDGSAIRRTQRRFVSKARQLEKLKSRFSLEKKNGMAPCCMVSACKGCHTGEVYL